MHEYLKNKIELYHSNDKRYVSSSHNSLSYNYLLLLARCAPTRKQVAECVIQISQPKQLRRNAGYLTHNYFLRKAVRLYNINLFIRTHMREVHPQMDVIMQGQTSQAATDDEYLLAWKAMESCK